MTRSIRLGRVAGIEIGINWTWFLVVALVVWSLAVGVFPDQNPGLSDVTYWIMGVVAAALFFTSILLHELGHALQARRDEVEIEGITLWLFGGVARFKGMYRTPGAEFRIAIAGPLVTVAIAAVLIAFGWALSLPDSVDGVIFWLGYINVFVLAFNLLPALPLDGGRLLHAALWRARGDLRWATRVGAAIGTAFGYVMIGGGVVLFVGTSAFGGLWLAIIGWFLAMAARAEAMQIEAREALHGARVSDLMAADPVVVPAEVSLGRFVDDVARSTRYATYPVVELGRPIGLLTFKCVAETPREQWDHLAVRDCMVSREEIPTLHGDEPAADALSELTDSEVRRGLVVQDDRLVGLLSISDLVRAIQTGPRHRREGPSPGPARLRRHHEDRAPSLADDRF